MFLRFSLLTVLVFFYFGSREQDLSADRAEHFIVKDGLPDAAITALCQDEDGFLWIGTSNGLSRYDGVAFKNYFHQKDNNSIPGNNIKGIVLLPGHRLLINTSTGLCIFYTTTGISKNLLVPSAAKAFVFENNFVAAAIDGQNNIWAGTQTCLYKLDTSLHILKTWRGFPEKGMEGSLLLYVHDIQPVSGGDILLKLEPPKQHVQYFLYSHSLNKIVGMDDPAAAAFTFADGFLTRDIRFNKNGDAFFIKYLQDSLYYFDHVSKQTTRYLITGIADKKQISYGSKLFLDEKNLLACSLSDGGIAYWNLTPDKANLFLKNEVTLTNKQIFCILPDASGNLWIGTNNGLVKFSSAIRHFDIVSFPEINTRTKEKIELQNIFTFDKTVFIGSNGGGFFFKTANSTWKNIVWNESSLEHYVWNISLKGTDSFYVATQNGIYYWNATDEKHAPFHWPQALKWINGLPVTANFTDSKDISWMGLGFGYGVAALNNKSGKIFIYSDAGKPQFPLRFPTAITEDEQGNLWMGGPNGAGIAKWSRSSNNFTLLSPVYNTDFDNGTINCLYADKKGYIWIGTASGLCSYNFSTNQFTKYDATSGLPSNAVNSIAEDAQKRLWIATKNGLCCMDMTTKKITTFNEFYHLQEPEINFVCFSKIENKIFFVTPHFFYSISPEDLLQQSTVPKVFINGASSSGDIQDISKKISLPFNNNNINISFTAVNLLNGQGNKYFYRLDTSSNKWQSIGNARQINFSNLSPGAYTFQVKAQTGNGTWSSNSAMLSFTIAAPFWKTWQFIISCILIIIAIVYLIYYYRVKQLLRIQQVRNTIATDLHDDIGSALTNINILAALTNVSGPQKSKEFLARISEEVNTSSQSLDDIVWSINSQNDSFEEIAARMRRYAAELFESANIQYQLEFDEKLSQKKLQMEQRRDLYLIFKEAVNNIYKHASASVVEIKLLALQNNFILNIKDNGKGFDTSLPTARNGIKNIVKRAKKWKGTAAINSSPDEGTSIIVSMPVINKSLK